MTRIKISGVTRPQDAELAVEVGADMVACVFDSASPRYVTIGQAVAIRRAVPAGIKLIGIFVDTPAPLVQRVVDSCDLDWIQLFGVEARVEIDGLRPYAFKGVVAKEPAELEAAFHNYLGRWSKFTPDQPALLVHLAGTLGQQWEPFSRRVTRAPILMAASSLNASTAWRAVHEAKPWGVDVWDAVEAAPGQLDAARLREFVAAVRAADQSGSPAQAAERRPRGRLPFGSRHSSDAPAPNPAEDGDEGATA